MKFIVLIILSFLLVNIVFAQSHRPCAVVVYGNFSNMITTGNAASNVSLFTLKNQHSLYGIGALAGLQGEIIIIDSKIYISYGLNNDGHTKLATARDNATMLVTAEVKKWKKIQVSTSMSSSEFEKFVLQQAALLGLTNRMPFPFMVKGNFKNIKWHVVEGLKSPIQGSKAHPVKKEFNVLKAQGTLLGFYVSPQLEGVASHPDDLFHIHYADKNNKHAGHVEDYAVSAEATLLLPMESISGAN